MLKRSSENEKSKINSLNDQILELNRKLYESELNDSLDSPKMHKSLRIKIETSCNINNNNNNQNITNETTNSIGMNKKVKEKLNYIITLHFLLN